MQPNILFESENHRVVVFNDLVTGDGIQANQLVIIHDSQSAVFDPGGDLTYMPLSMALSKYVRVKDINYVIATHQDPDVVSSVDKWLMYSDAKVVISRLWERFVPHLVPGYMKGKGVGRILGIPDQGFDIDLGGAIIKALPAHFLHAVGNFHFYDETSRILFSGDMGASMVDGDNCQPVQNFAAHIDSMLGFHKRYMVSNKVCRLWANMVRQLDVQMIVPQHGAPFEGRGMIEEFLCWIEQLECGIDNLTQTNYQIP